MIYIISICAGGLALFTAAAAVTLYVQMFCIPPKNSKVNGSPAELPPQIRETNRLRGITVIIIRDCMQQLRQENMLENQYRRAGADTIYLDCGMEERKKPMGMGFGNIKNIETLINRISNKEGCRIILHGMGSGGAAALEYIELCRKRKILTYPDAVIADSCYTGLKDLIRYRIRKTICITPALKIISYCIVSVMSVINACCSGFFFICDSPKNALNNRKKNEKAQSVPVLLLHGSKNRYTPFFMAEQLLKVSGGINTELIVSEKDSYVSEINFNKITDFIIKKETGC